MDSSLIILRIAIFLLGFFLVGGTLFSAMETFVVPRSTRDPLTRFVFIVTRAFFSLIIKNARTYIQRDQIMSFYAPVSLLLLVPVWYILVLIGFMGMFWGTGVDSWVIAFRDSGSSLLTLGFAPVDGLFRSMLAFSEAAFGLLLVALLIAYLPTMYSAFSRREAAVTLLEVRAGSPPSAGEMLRRYYRIHGFYQLTEVWSNWESWFADIEESHTSLPALVFFRSPQPEHSWITAAGAVLDAASLMQSTVDFRDDPQAALCIRAGYLALRRIADFFSISYNTAPQRGDPIEITREEYNRVVAELEDAGIPIKTDRETAWLDFCGWRVNYERVLLVLAKMIMAPPSLWTGIRSDQYHIPHVFGKWKN